MCLPGEMKYGRNGLLQKPPVIWYQDQSAANPRSLATEHRTKLIFLTFPALHSWQESCLLTYSLLCCAGREPETCTAVIAQRPGTGQSRLRAQFFVAELTTGGY